MAEAIPRRAEVSSLSGAASQRPFDTEGVQ